MIEVNVIVGVSCDFARSSCKWPIEAVCCLLLAWSSTLLVRWLVVPVSQAGEKLCMPLILSSNHLQTPQYSETLIIRTLVIRTLCLGPCIYAYINKHHRLSERFHLVPASLDNWDCTTYSVATNELFQFVTSLSYCSQRTLWCSQLNSHYHYSTVDTLAGLFS